MIDFVSLAIILAIDAFMVAIALKYRATVFSTLAGLMLTFVLAFTMNAGGIAGSGDYQSLFLSIMMLAGVDFLVTIGIRLGMS